MSESGNGRNEAARPASPHSRPLIHGDDDPLLPHLAASFPRAKLVCVAVAFVLDQGVDLIRPFLVDLLASGGELRLLTADEKHARADEWLQVNLAPAVLPEPIRRRIIQAAVLFRMGPDAPGGAFPPGDNLLGQR